MRTHVARPEERVAKLVGWGTAIALLLAVAWLAGFVPYGLLVLDPYAEPDGDAFVDGWLAVPFHLGALLVAGLGAAATLRLQRGQPDRFEPLAVCAVALGVAGHSATIAALQWTALYVMHPALGLLRLGEALMAGAVLCGLAALPRLFARRTRRGWGMALAAAGICALVLFAVERFFLHPPPPAEPADGVELAAVEYAISLKPDPEPPWRVASLRADGSLVIEGRELAAGAYDGWLERLREVAARMEHYDGRPDDPLAIRADGRAPAREVARLSELAREAGIWKQMFELARPEAWHPLLRRGFAPLYWSYGSAREDRDSAAADGSLLRVVRAPSGAARYELGGEVREEARELRPLIAARELDFLVEVDGELPWSAVIAALDTPELGRESLILAGLLLAE